MAGCLIKEKLMPSQLIFFVNIAFSFIV